MARRESVEVAPTGTLSMMLAQDNSLDFLFYRVVVKEKVKSGHPPFLRAARESRNQENLMKISRLFAARTALCIAIIALCAQGQNAGSSRASSLPSAGSSEILCGPGLVYRCTPQGCYCVKPGL